MRAHSPPQKGKCPSVTQLPANLSLRSKRTSIPRCQHSSVNGNVIGMEGQGLWVDLVDKVGKGTRGGLARETVAAVFFGGGYSLHVSTR